MSLIVIKKIIEMFMILLVGVIIYKGKIIDDVSTKHLSNVLLLLVSPLLIVQSYQIDFNKKLMDYSGRCWLLFLRFCLLSLYRSSFFMGIGIEVQWRRLQCLIRILDLLVFL